MIPKVEIIYQLQYSKYKTVLLHSGGNVRFVPLVYAVELKQTYSTVERFFLLKIF